MVEGPDSTDTRIVLGVCAVVMMVSFGRNPTLRQLCLVAETAYEVVLSSRCRWNVPSSCGWVQSGQDMVQEKTPPPVDEEPVRVHSPVCRLHRRACPPERR